MSVNLPIVDDYRVTTPDDQCSYLPDRRSSFDFRVITQLEANEYDHLLERGWRRHGLHIFRPTCASCNQCVSLRVDVDTFAPTKSQRRVLRKNEDVECYVRPPSITSEHIDVFNRYHADMQARRGWRENKTTPADYFESFLSGNYDFENEFLFVRSKKLIGVGLVDATATSASSVYFYHDPEWREGAPGTFSMLTELNYLKQIGVKKHYLGYWIRDCQSMAYKSRFGPHELLNGYVPDDAVPDWQDKVDAV